LIIVTNATRMQFYLKM